MIEAIVDKSLIFYRKLHEAVCKFRIYGRKPIPVNGKIFLYHGLTDKEDFFKHINIEKFERHIKFLCTYYKPVHLDELIKMDDQEKKNAFAITFDDGYESIYTLAYPILKKYNVPFTFFLITDTIENDEFIWNDRIDNTIKGINRKFISINFRDQEIKMKISGNYRLGLQLSILKNKLKFLNYSEINDFISTIEKKYSPSINYGELDRVVTVDKVKEMINSGLCKIGSHTCNHVSLISIPIEEINYQVEKSLEWLQKEIGHGNYFFCYPHGHFDSQVRDIVKQNGYLGAVTTERGDNLEIDDIFLIKRNPVNMEDICRFRILHDL